jgi:hypothetical protein
MFGVYVVFRVFYVCCVVYVWRLFPFSFLFCIIHLSFLFLLHSGFSTWAWTCDGHGLDLWVWMGWHFSTGVAGQDKGVFITIIQRYPFHLRISILHHFNET